MSWATAIVLIVLISAIAGYLRRKGKGNGGAIDRLHPGADESQTRREAELKDEVEELRERVKVLERITVDGREARAIADEIEKLRED